jgi:diguanylate cyclase (GGDEF)-like protein
MYDDFEEKTAIISTTDDNVGKNLVDNTNFYLIEIYGEKLGRKTILEKEKISIGRGLNNDIVIDSSSVSRNHALIYKKISFDGYTTVYIKDLGSTNGTYVKDRQIPQNRGVELEDGVTIKVGSTIYKFLIGNDLESNYFEEIYRLTIVDGLTEIYNKRAFLETLEREFNRSQRYNRPLSMIIFDIDHFKNVNDTYGHLTGDYVLKHMSKIIKQSVRTEEFLARYGGEEFTIIMPESTRGPAIKLGEKIRLLVESTTFHFEGKIIPITISVGVATLSNNISNPMELISLADKNLYQAKSSGRNRVVG